MKISVRVRYEYTIDRIRQNKNNKEATCPFFRVVLIGICHAQNLIASSRLQFRYLEVLLGLRDHLTVEAFSNNFFVSEYWQSGAHLCCHIVSETDKVRWWGFSSHVDHVGILVDVSQDTFGKFGTMASVLMTWKDHDLTDSGTILVWPGIVAVDTQITNCQVSEFII